MFRCIDRRRLESTLRSLAASESRSPMCVVAEQRRALVRTPTRARTVAGHARNSARLARSL